MKTVEVFRAFPYQHLAWKAAYRFLGDAMESEDPHSALFAIPTASFSSFGGLTR
jgi:hypothetical protein